MITEFEVVFFDGADNISPTLTFDIVVPYVTGDKTRTFTLSAGTPTTTIELVSLKNKGFDITFTYNATTGILLITGDLYPTSKVPLNMTLSSTSYPTDTITTNIELYNIDSAGKIYISDSAINIKSSIFVLQEPLTDIVHYYNLTNAVITNAILNSNNITISYSPTGISTETTDSTYNLTLTYIDMSTGLPITYTDTSNVIFIHNTFLPNTNTAFSDNGFLVDNLPTYNTDFISKLQSDYTNILTGIQSERITGTNIATVDITDVANTTIYKEHIFKFITNSTNLELFNFATVNHFTEGSYTATFKNIRTDKFLVEPSADTSLTSGKYYLVAVKEDCTSITDGTTPISISSVNQIIYIDPINYGAVGTSVTFTGFSGLYLIELYGDSDIITDNAYFIVGGSIVINGVTYTTNDSFILNYFDIYSSTSLLVIPLNMVTFFEYDYTFSVDNQLVITNSKCGTYNIYNKYLKAIDITLAKLIYTVDKQGTYEEIDTYTISSNESLAITVDDGVYKITLDNNEYIFVSTCKIDSCIINYINNFICKDSCSEQSCNCNYSDNDYCEYQLLYFILQSLINELFTTDTKYKNVVLLDTLKLHSITDTINKLLNFCNSCANE